MLLSEGQMSDYKGAALMLSAMPKAKQLLADKGYDADWLRRRLVPRRPRQAPHHRLHSFQSQSQNRDTP